MYSRPISTLYIDFTCLLRLLRNLLMSAVNYRIAASKVD
jgi:hypothetical protein